MDIVTLAMAKKYTDQKAGYTEYTYDNIFFWGDFEGKLLLPASEFDINVPNLAYVRVTDQVINASGIRYTGKTHSDGTSGFDYSVQNLIEYDGIYMVYAQSSKYPDVIVIDAPPETGINGVYVWCLFVTDSFEVLQSYISRFGGYIEETIHHIDPKYIPPLDSITLNGADGKQYKVAVDETGTLTATAIE